MLPRSALVFALALSALALLQTGCRRDMQDQPRYKPLAATDFFGDGRSARPLVEDTVARGHLEIDQAFFTGKVNGEDVDTFPFAITRADCCAGRSGSTFIVRRVIAAWATATAWWSSAASARPRIITRSG